MFLRFEAYCASAGCVTMIDPQQVAAVNELQVGVDGDGNPVKVANITLKGGSKILVYDDQRTVMNKIDDAVAGAPPTLPKPASAPID